MRWTEVGNLRKQYTSGEAAAQPAPNVHVHLDEVAQAATSIIAEGGVCAASHQAWRASRHERDSSSYLPGI